MLEQIQSALTVCLFLIKVNLCYMVLFLSFNAYEVQYNKIYYVFLCTIFVFDACVFF